MVAAGLVIVARADRGLLAAAGSTRRLTNNDSVPAVIAVVAGALVGTTALLFVFLILFYKAKRDSLYPPRPNLKTQGSLTPAGPEARSSEPPVFEIVDYRTTDTESPVEEPQKSQDNPKAVATETGKNEEKLYKKDSLLTHDGCASTEKEAIVTEKERACAADGCSYQATWHPTHCCGRCCDGKDGHGTRCEMKLMPDQGQMELVTESSDSATKQLDVKAATLADKALGQDAGKSIYGMILDRDGPKDASISAKAGSTPKAPMLVNTLASLESEEVMSSPARLHVVKTTESLDAGVGYRSRFCCVSCPCTTVNDPVLK